MPLGIFWEYKDILRIERISGLYIEKFKLEIEILERK